MRAAAFLLAFSTLVGGCFAQAALPRPELRDFERCDFRFPDNSTVPCEDRSRRVEAVASGLNPGWICLDRAANTFSSAEIHRRGVNEYALRFTAHTTTVRGLVLLPKTDQMLSFKHADRSGFLELGTFDQVPHVKVLLYEASIATDNVLLKNALLDVLWSTHDAKAWPLLRAQGALATYYFRSVVVVDNAPALVSAGFDGEDYSFQFHYRRLLNAGFTPPEGTPNVDCQR